MYSDYKEVHALFRWKSDATIFTNKFIHFLILCLYIHRDPTHVQLFPLLEKRKKEIDWFRAKFEIPKM